VINHAHMLGFLDPNLPRRGERAVAVESAPSSAS
jgi:hypothetical protein